MRERIMKMQAVRLRAKHLGIHSSGKKKTDLIREIQRAEGNFDCFGSGKDYCDQESCCFRSLCLGGVPESESRSLKSKRV